MAKKKKLKKKKTTKQKTVKPKTLKVKRRGKRIEKTIDHFETEEFQDFELQEDIEDFDDGQMSFF